MSTVLLHPTYFPSIAHMAVIAQAEQVVFEACDNYQKQTYRNRCYIAHANGKLLLNVPIRHSKDGHRQQTAEVAPENNFPWLDQHWKSLQSAYRTSPYFEFYEDELRQLFEFPVSNLLTFNLATFDKLCSLLEIKCSYTLTTRYRPTTNLTDYRFLVRAKKGATFNFEPYTQVFSDRHGFISNLSVLDLLFNLGPNCLSYLKAQRVDRPV
jgi:hypothetical protein